MQDDVSRRNFVKTAALVAAPGILLAQNAGTKIRVGWIGVGGRGSYLLDRMKQGAGDQVQVTAVCDTYAPRLNASKDKVQTLWQNTPKAYEDFRELLADPNVDA
jgi:predicted dehydrogenase